MTPRSVRDQGFEPRLKEPESCVLPLHQSRSDDRSEIFRGQRTSKYDRSRGFVKTGWCPACPVAKTLLQPPCFWSHFRRLERRSEVKGGDYTCSRKVDQLIHPKIPPPTANTPSITYLMDPSRPLKGARSIPMRPKPRSEIKRTRTRMEMTIAEIHKILGISNFPQGSKSAFGIRGRR